MCRTNLLAGDQLPMHVSSFAYDLFQSFICSVHARIGPLGSVRCWIFEHYLLILLWLITSSKQCSKGEGRSVFLGLKIYRWRQDSYYLEEFAYWLVREFFKVKGVLLTFRGETPFSCFITSGIREWYCEADPGLRIQQTDEILLLQSSLSKGGRQTLRKHSGYHMSAVEKT